MKLFTFLFIVLVSISTPSYSMKSGFARDEYVPRGMLIFLDDSEGKNIGAIGGSFVSALSQHAGPIIVSASLLYGIFDGFNYQFKGQDPKVLEEKFFKEGYVAGENKKSDIGRSILLEAAHFNPNEWIIKKLNDHLYMFIPHVYLHQVGISVASVVDSGRSTITETEYKLGIKVNHMETVRFDMFTRGVAGPQMSRHYFLQALYDVGTQQSSIFCTRSDYRSQLSIKQPLWSIYMEGHGLMEQQIVGMKLNDFKEALDFFEHKITTELLVYMTCYGAGTNNEIILKDSKNALQRTYLFTIVTKAITDAVTSESKPQVIVDNNRLVLNYPMNFVGFLKEILTAQTLDYEKMVTLLFPVTPRGEFAWQAGVWGNVPQIKLPGVEWFTVVADHKQVVSIGSILSKTRGVKPLNVVKFFKTDPKALLLYASDVPFELIINSKNMEAIISMIPGDAIHKIAKISSTMNKTVDIINWFMQIHMLEPRKIFYIKQLNSATDVIIYYNTVKSGIGTTAETIYNVRAFFKEGGTMFIKERNKTPQPMPENMRKLYESLVAQFQEGIKKFGSYKFKLYRTLKFPTIENDNDIMAIFEKIELEGDDIDLKDVIDALKRPDSIMWVNQLSGRYTKGIFEILNLEYGKNVVLNNVIVDMINRKLLFTHNGKSYEKNLDNWGDKGKTVSDYTNEYKQLMQNGVKKAGISEFTPERAREMMIVFEKQIKKIAALPKIIKPIKPSGSAVQAPVTTTIKPVTQPSSVQPIKPIVAPIPSVIVTPSVPPSPQAAVGTSISTGSSGQAFVPQVKTLGDLLKDFATSLNGLSRSIRIIP